MRNRALLSVLLLGSLGRAASLDEIVEGRVGCTENKKFVYEVTDETRTFAQTLIRPAGEQPQVDLPGTTNRLVSAYSFLRSTVYDEVRGEFALFSFGSKKYEKRSLRLLYGDGWQGGFQFRNGVGPDLDREHVFEVCRTSFGRHSALNPFDMSRRLRPEAWILLAGADPKGMFGYFVDWVPDGDGYTGRTRSVGHDGRPANAQFRMTWRFEVHVSQKYKAVTSFSASEEGIPRDKWEVVEWTEEDGHTYPAKVLSKHWIGSLTQPVAETSREWKLESIEPVTATPLPIPKGIDVGDFRLAPADLSPMTFPGDGQKPVVYAWSGYFPTTDWLRGNVKPSGRRAPVAVLVVGGSLLLLGSWLLLRRRS